MKAAKGKYFRGDELNSIRAALANTDGK